MWLFALLGLLLLVAVPPTHGQDCCGCGDCCCGGGNDDLLAALLGGDGTGLAVGRRRRDTAAGQSADHQQKASAEKSAQFRPGKDDPTPHLMGWRIPPGTAMRPAKPAATSSLVDEWYKHAFAEERERARQRAKLRQKPSAPVSSNDNNRRSWRQKRLAQQLLSDAIGRVVKLRRARAEQAATATAQAAGTNAGQQKATKKAGEEKPKEEEEAHQRREDSAPGAVNE